MTRHPIVASLMSLVQAAIGVMALLAALLSSPAALSDFETEIAAEGSK